MWLGKRTGTQKKGAKIGKNQCSEDTLWKWFSKYIRLRDADANGICRCASCNKYFHWKSMDAGHFVSRRHKAVKYDERNVMAQCQSCNRFNSGEQFKMGQEIDRRHGKGTAKLVSEISRCRMKFDGYWFKAKSDEYRLKVKQLAKEKGQIV